MTTVIFFLQPHGAYYASVWEPKQYSEVLIEMREGGCAGEKGAMKGAHAFLAELAREALTKNR